METVRVAPWVSAGTVFEDDVARDSFRRA